MRRVVCGLVVGVLLSSALRGDGFVRPPRGYQGSFEEQAQEAIIVFQAGDKPGEAVEDLILKIRVEGDQDLSGFSWIVPLPAAPETFKEDPVLFQELFNYVEERTWQPHFGGGGNTPGPAAEPAKREAVTVVSRNIVGSFDVAVVKENEAGALNRWLEKEGFQTISGGDDVIGYYRKKNYVFACVKVNDPLKTGTSADLHPLRFRFKTGGRDGIYFPMKLTGLQTKPFDVNLYVFYRFWLNDKLNSYGYQHQGFQRNYRDWDTPRCVPNGGKNWSRPETDPLLKNLADKVPTVKTFFQKHFKEQRFYLTNIQAFGLDPKKVRQGPDLWLYPYYTNRQFVPYDLRK